MAKFISVAQLKGGAGKSTIATNLAGCLAREFRTGLIDADMPQGTAARWAALRQDANLDVVTCESAADLAREAERLDDLCEVVVIDLPPRSLKFLREIMPFTDLVIMPLTASAPDVWATEQLVEVVREARKTSKRLKARLVWNRLRASKASDAFLADTAQSLRAKELSSQLGSRTAYIEAMGRGLTVTEWRDAKASAEFEVFLREVREQLKLG